MGLERSWVGLCRLAHWLPLAPVDTDRQGFLTGSSSSDAKSSCIVLPSDCLLPGEWQAVLRGLPPQSYGMGTRSAEHFRKVAFPGEEQATMLLGLSAGGGHLCQAPTYSARTSPALCQSSGCIPRHGIRPFWCPKRHPSPQLALPLQPSGEPARCPFTFA